MNPLSAAATAAVSALTHHELLELGVAGGCLVVALHYLRQAVVPVGALLRVAAATMMVALGIAAALILLVAVTLTRQ